MMMHSVPASPLCPSITVQDLDQASNQIALEYTYQLKQLSPYTYEFRTPTLLCKFELVVEYNEIHMDTRVHVYMLIFYIVMFTVI